MKNIAIFVSGNGEASERIINLFNEGNRLKTVLVVADDSATDMNEKLTGKDVTLLHIPDSELSGRWNEIETLLRENDVRLIVLDNYAHPVPDSAVEAAGGKIITVSTVQEAPREVVAALDEDLRKPVKEEPEIEVTENPTPEHEWASALNINYRPPKLVTTPPPVPMEESGNEPARKETETPFEPMPPTYLIWSILVTVFCCFIPGIIAIIFSSQVSSRYFSGDIEGAKKSSRTAEIWIIVSFVLGVLAATLYIPFLMI